jgi:hypothetical protein
MSLPNSQEKKETKFRDDLTDMIRGIIHEE